jgi:pSer/pThr/pTyr-binding forkhead associated (FHA) protein
VVDLLVLNGSRAGARFALTDLPVVLGRSEEAHLRLDDPWISTLHALFERRGEAHWVIDFGSRNGTLVGGERILEAELVIGATVSFGRTRIRVECHVEAEAPAAAPAPSPGRARALPATVRLVDSSGARRPDRRRHGGRRRVP